MVAAILIGGHHDGKIVPIRAEMMPDVYDTAVPDSRIGDRLTFLPEGDYSEPDKIYAPGDAKVAIERYVSLKPLGRLQRQAGQDSDVWWDLIPYLCEGLNPVEELWRVFHQWASKPKGGE